MKHLRLALAALTLAALGCTKTIPTDPNAGSDDGECRAGTLQPALTSLKTVDAADRATLALTALAEGCPLSTGIKNTFAAVGSVSPADAATIVAAGMAEEKDFWRGACADKGVLDAVVNVAPADRAGMLYDGCEFARLNLASKEEMQAAFRGEGRSAVGALTAFPTYVWLATHGVKPGVARDFARLMLGLDS